MERLFGLLFGLLVVLLVLAAGFLLGTVLFAVAGLYMVQAKYPLVPKGISRPKAFAFAAIWAYAITIALYIGSAISHEALIGKADLDNFRSSLSHPALVFFAESVLVMFVASNIAGSDLAKRNITLAKAAAAAFGAAMFATISPLAEIGVKDLKVVYDQFFDGKISVLIFVYDVISTAGADLFSKLWGAIKTGQGNLFSMSDSIFWMLSLYSVIQFIRGIKKDDAVQHVDATGNKVPASKFVWLILSFLISLVPFTILVISSFHSPTHQYFIPTPTQEYWAIIIFGTLILWLGVNLFKTRFHQATQ